MNLGIEFGQHSLHETTELVQPILFVYRLMKDFQRKKFFDTLIIVHVCIGMH